MYSQKKNDARAKMAQAIARGELVRQPCVVCGNPLTEGHHTDYDYPLQVIWLCAEHHTTLHNHGDTPRKTMLAVYVSQELRDRLTPYRLEGRCNQIINEAIKTYLDKISSVETEYCVWFIDADNTVKSEIFRGTADTMIEKYPMLVKSELANKITPDEPIQTWQVKVLKKNGYYRYEAFTGTRTQMYSLYGNRLAEAI